MRILGSCLLEGVMDLTWTITHKVFLMCILQSNAYFKQFCYYIFANKKRASEKKEQDALIKNILYKTRQFNKKKTTL